MLNLESEVLLTKDIATEMSEENNDPNIGAIKIKGQALIKYLFGNCEDSFKNAVNRDTNELENRFEMHKNQRYQSFCITNFKKKNKLFILTGEQNPYRIT